MMYQNYVATCLLFAIKLGALLQLTNAMGEIFKLSNSVDTRAMVPVLGRGFSPATEVYYSKCLINSVTINTDIDVGDDALPAIIQDGTFDYDYMMMEIKLNSNSTANRSDTGDDIPDLSSWKKNPSQLDLMQLLTGTKEKNDVKTVSDLKTHIIVASMSLDKYSSQANEARTQLDPNVLGLLKRYDIIGAFSVCGPQFVRGIRRTSEVFTVFTYLSTETSKEFKKSLEDKTIKIDATKAVDKDDPYEDITVKTSTSFSTLIISIKAYGVDFQWGDGNSLVATSMDEYGQIMETGFRMMLNPDAGMITSIEIVPWTANVHFQAGIGMDKEVRYVVDGTEKVFPSSLKQMYVFANAELYLEIEHIFRYKMNMLQKLSHCLNVLYTYSELTLCHNYMKHNTWYMMPTHYVAMQIFTRSQTLTQPGASQWDTDEERAIQLYRLKYLLEGQAEDTDPQKHLVEKVGEDFMNWVNGYYIPCIQEMTADRYGVKLGAMFTKHWSKFETCRKVTCLFTHAQWDSGTSKCTLNPRIVTRWDDLVNTFCPASGPLMEYDSFLQWGNNCGVDLANIYPVVN